MEKDGTVNEQETPVPPAWLQDEMRKDNGYNPTLIDNEKTLTATDMALYHSRLCLPKKLKTEFLTKEEKETLKKKAANKQHKQGVNVFFLDPQEKKHDVELKEWETGLALIKWGTVIKEYTDFAEGKIYSFWCYRVKEGNKLCFSLVSKEKDVLKDQEEEDVAKEEDALKDQEQGPEEDAPSEEEGPKDQEDMPQYIPADVEDITKGLADMNSLDETEDVIKLFEESGLF